MAVQWYALRSKPRKEDMIWGQLNAQGIENFYPRLRIHPVNPRARKIKPYFPGYMFVRIDIESSGISIFKWMPHTLGLVSFGGEPALVPDNLIYEIKNRIQKINEAGGEVFDGLKSGDKIRIEAGPFEGYDAIFDTRIEGKDRVRVLLQFLGNPRDVPIELNVSQIKRED
jgi:transcription antitermination factor NusG